MKKIIFLSLIIVTCFYIKTLGQTTSQIKKVISNKITLNEKTYLLDDYKNRCFIFSVGVSISHSGTIDSVFFSEKSQLFLGRLINFKSILDDLMSVKATFVKYKNNTFIMPVMVTRGNSNLAENMDELEDGWQGIINQVKALEKEGKTVILLTPEHLTAASRYVIE